MREEFAAHTFTSLEDLPFERSLYSCMKFGCDESAKQMGYDLANQFFIAHIEAVMTGQLMIICSPYFYIPNAASVMTRHFMDRLNHISSQAGGNTASISVARRRISYVRDYGFLSEEMRRAQSAGDQIYFNKEFIDGKTLVFVDDVKITGTHEDKIVSSMRDSHLNNDVFFLYFAKYMGDRPTIEAELNFGAINNIDDYIALANQPNHRVIVRPIKYLLGQKEDVFKASLPKIPTNILLDIYGGALGEGYATVPDYSKNVQTLGRFLFTQDFLIKGNLNIMRRHEIAALTEAKA